MVRETLSLVVGVSDRGGPRRLFGLSTGRPGTCGDVLSWRRQREPRHSANTAFIWADSGLGSPCDRKDYGWTHLPRHDGGRGEGEIHRADGAALPRMEGGRKGPADFSQAGALGRLEARQTGMPFHPGQQQELPRMVPVSPASQCTHRGCARISAPESQHSAFPLNVSPLGIQS